MKIRIPTTMDSIKIFEIQESVIIKSQNFQSLMSLEHFWLLHNIQILEEISMCTYNIIIFCNIKIYVQHYWVVTFLYFEIKGYALIYLVHSRCLKIYCRNLRWLQVYNDSFARETKQYVLKNCLKKDVIRKLSYVDQFNS